MTTTDKNVCPWCGADTLDTFNFACGSIRPSYVTPSAMQADKCKVGLLVRACEKALAHFTNPNTYEAGEVVCAIISALSSVGHDKDELDRAAIMVLRDTFVERTA